MLKTFRHRRRKNDFALADFIRGKVVVNKHGYVIVFSKNPFKTVRKDIFKNDYVLDEENSNKEFIKRFKKEISLKKKRFNNSGERYEWWHKSKAFIRKTWTIGWK